MLNHAVRNDRFGITLLILTGLALAGSVWAALARDRVDEPSRDCPIRAFSDRKY